MEIAAFYFNFCLFHALASSIPKKEVFIRLNPSRSQFLQYEFVSLSCEVSAGRSQLKRNTTNRGTETCPYGWGNLMDSGCTITTLYPSDTGVYWCESSSGQKSQTVNIEVAAVLTVLPNRSQFFQYESVSLSCGQQGNWRVKKNTSVNINQECLSSWDRICDSDCLIEDLYPSDSGVYWCESAAGECSEAVNITVTGGSVILEGPVHPVMEGDNVTLCCTNRTPFFFNVLTYFFKDGSLIRRSSTGNMTIHSVSKSDEGLYKCNISGAGESPDTWLTVRDQGSDAAVPDASAAPVFSASRVIWHLIVGIPYILSTIILGLIYRDNRRAQQVVAEDRRHKVIMEVE